LAVPQNDSSGWTLTLRGNQIDSVWLEGGLLMSFGLYLVGFCILILGLAIGANLMNVPARWIGVGALVLLGLGIVSAVARTRQRDPQ
jgi:hypothetical protein